jgi:hypothetical protein
LVKAETKSALGLRRAWSQRDGNGADDGEVRAGGIIVNGRQAVDILATKASWAAAWWLEQAPHVVVGDYRLVFSVEVCEVV